MKNKLKSKNIFLRYGLMFILVDLFLLSYFSNFLSFIFTQISYFVLNLFFNVSLISGNILWNNNLFLIVGECIGISAYILLTFLFFSMNIDKKILFKGWFYSIFWFSIANLIRIIILMIIFIIFGKNFFDSIHILFYEFLTGIIVGVIFLIFYKKYKIKKRPLIDDYKCIFSLFQKK